MAEAALLPEIETALATHGLALRGGFVFEAGDQAPTGPDGVAAKCVLLVGHHGGSSWPHFSAWRARQANNLADPLDTWSKEVIGAMAERFGARAVYPSDPPYQPFQQWAMRAEGLKPSPLGILMHPLSGLWHAYRGALLFSVDVLIQQPVQKVSHACAGCAAKPCLSACPVNAYSESGFDVEACRAHVRSAAGQVCREAGCLVRNACPVGAEHRYSADQQAFHQRAFARL